MKIGAYCTVFFCLIIFAGCTIKDTVKNRPDEEVLRERVTEYWNLKMQEEFIKAYEYEDPLYRKNETVIRYLRGFQGTANLKWKAASVEKMKIEGDFGKVDLKVRVNVKLPMMKRMEHDSYVEEKWVKVEGVWYHIPDRFMAQRGVR